ncbi:MAG: hypothetical protein RL204_466 [Bacteroidota bacterium]|jgi:hypothetical protein
MKTSIGNLKQVIEESTSEIEHIKYSDDYSSEFVISNFSDGERIFQIVHPYKIKMQSCLNYYALGELDRNWKSFNTTLLIESRSENKKERIQIDLYNRKHLIEASHNLSSTFSLQEESILLDLHYFTDFLEKYRDSHLVEKLEPSINPEIQRIPNELKARCIGFLNRDNLIDEIDNELKILNFAAQKSRRLLLFFTSISFLWDEPMRLLLAENGIFERNKIVNALEKLIPPDNLIVADSIVSKNILQLQRDELIHKLIIVRDFDFLDKATKRALLSIPTKGSIGRVYRYRNFLGYHVSESRTQRVCFSLIGICSQTIIRHEALNSSIVLQQRTDIDEEFFHCSEFDLSKNTKKSNHQTLPLLQGCYRLLKAYKVEIPCIDKLVLPRGIFGNREQCSIYLNLVKLIANFHQFQRKVDNRGLITANKEDLIIAFEILCDVLSDQTDELEKPIRLVYEKLKSFRPNGDLNQDEVFFSALQMRTSLNLSKSSCFRILDTLVKLEYVIRKGGSSNRGYKYCVSYKDNFQESRQILKDQFVEQINNLFR